MKILFHNGEEYTAKRIVKTDTNIIGYIDNQEVFAFRGISDFTQFKLAEGQTFDTDPEAEKEQRIADLEAAIATIIGGGA